MELKLANLPNELLFLYETRKNPQVDNMLSGVAPKDYSSHLKYLENVQEKTRWIYVAYENNNLVGYSQIYDITDTSCEVGFAINPSYQGKGYGKELVKLTCAKAKDLFKDKKIILYVLKKNLKAINIYSKIGFKEKTLKNSSEELIGMVLEE